MPAKKSFASIEKVALKRKGGRAALDALMPEVTSTRSLRRLKDRDVLSALSKGVFSAGFVWRVVDNKWPEMSAVLLDFDPVKLARLTPLEIAELCEDTRVIRHRKKLESVRDNARLLLELNEEHGSAAKLIADWAEADIVSLWGLLKKRGKRLGGMTGPYALRRLGKDTFLLTGDVVTALQHAGVITGKGTSQRDRKAAQEAFNHWHEQTGKPYAHLSRTLACTVASSYELQ